MKMFQKAIAMIVALCLVCGLAVSASAVTFADAHVPSSSSISREAASAGVSPGSIRPPGKHGSPAWGMPEARTSMRSSGSSPVHRIGMTTA